MKQPIPFVRGLGILSLALSASAVQAAITFVNSTSSAGFGSIAVLDDFESFAPKDVVLPSLVSGGITYNAINQNVLVASPGYTNFGIAGATTTSILTTSGDEDFEMLPSFVSRRLGFDIYTIDDPGFINSVPGAPPVRVTVTSTTDFATYDIPAPTGNFGFLGIVSDDPILKVTWLGVLGGIRNTGIDNIRTSAAVPEPASLAIVAAGMAAMMRRKRRLA